MQSQHCKKKKTSLPDGHAPHYSSRNTATQEYPSVRGQCMSTICADSYRACVCPSKLDRSAYIPTNNTVCFTGYPQPWLCQRRKTVSRDAIPSPFRGCPTTFHAAARDHFSGASAVLRVLQYVARSCTTMPTVGLCAFGGSGRGPAGNVAYCAKGC